MSVNKGGVDTEIMTGRYIADADILTPTVYVRKHISTRDILRSFGDIGLLTITVTSAGSVKYPRVLRGRSARRMTFIRWEFAKIIDMKPVGLSCAVIVSAADA